MMHEVLKQKRSDQNKIYSLHEPAVECISKGKAHKRYEFGVKASIAMIAQSGIIVGAMSLPGNPYDGNTLEEVLDQVSELQGQRPESCLLDKGYRGVKEVGTTQILLPKSVRKNDSYYKRTKHKNEWPAVRRLSRLSAI